jgi:hypothetical protein
VRAVKHIAANRDDVGDPELLYLSTLRATDQDGLLEHEHERWVELKAERERRQAEERRNRQRRRDEGVEEDLYRLARIQEQEMRVQGGGGGGMGRGAKDATGMSTLLREDQCIACMAGDVRQRECS